MPSEIAARASLALSHQDNTASQREFLLYWAGFIVLVFGAVSILLTISGLMVDLLSYRCWYPIISPMLGINQPPPDQTGIGTIPSYYCADPAAALVRFVFNLLSALIIGGAGAWMMLNGNKN